jgi:hypothetical protein
MRPFDARAQGTGNSSSSHAALAGIGRASITYWRYAMTSYFKMFAATAALVAFTAPQSVLAAGAQASKGSAPPTAAAKAADERARVTARAAALYDWATALTVEMNKATGQAKIEAMARLLNALVQQRAMMVEEMKMMQDDLDAQHEAMQRMMHRGSGAQPLAK